MKLILMAVASLMAITAQAGTPSMEVWRDGNLNVWQSHYGKPVKIENGYQYYWNVSRFQVEVSFSDSGKLACFNIEAREGKQPLTFTEAKALADKLGFGPYHIDDGAPAWGDPSDMLSPTAFFEDASFHFEAVHEERETE